MENVTNTGRGPEAPDRQHRKAPAMPNGAATESAGPGDGAGTDAREQAMRQAEEMADRLAERVGYYASWISREVMRLAARAREEMQDIWAEAQHLSQKKRDEG
jgi:hypothetical protein